MNALWKLNPALHVKVVNLALPSGVETTDNRIIYFVSIVTSENENERKFFSIAVFYWSNYKM